MRTITDYAELVALATGYLRPGVCTNTMVTMETYARDIAAGLIRVAETETGLFLLRYRPGHTRLTFFLTGPEAVPTDLSLFEDNVPLVTEIACPSGDKRLKACVEAWKRAGMTLAVERLRLSRKVIFSSINGEQGGSNPVRLLRESEAGQGLALLQECFSPLTGCVPTPSEWLSAVQTGEILTIGNVDGILHFHVSSKAAEIRHMAIREELRGQGKSELLLKGFTAACGLRCTVWTGQELLAAQRAYLHAGFVPDGRISAVLVRQ